MRPRALTSPLALLALLSPLAAPAGAQSWSVQDLGTLGGELANALGINQLGQVVGQAEAPGFLSQAFVWSGGSMSVVPGLNPSDSGRADGINQAGEVVGSSMAPYPGGPGWVGHAFFWSPATGPIDLTPGATASSQATAINDARQVVGGLGGPAGGARLWSIDAQGQVSTTPIALSGAPPGFSNQANDINASGLVVGVGYNASFQYRAWKWSGSGDAVELPTLGGVQSIAEGVNDAGEICGSAQLPNNLHVPVKWLPDGSVVELGLLPLPNVFSSEARSINNLGQVVGAELYIDPLTGLGASAPWVWTAGSKQPLKELLSAEDRLEWDLRWATGINDAGQIVGIAIRTIGGVEYPGRAFLLTPPDAPVGSALCFGDGSGTPCPCGNAGSSRSGCANSTGAGARLAGAGSASVALDALHFAAQALPAGQPVLLFAGHNAVEGGSGAIFGDGLRCAGGNLRRLGTQHADAQGESGWGPGLGASGAWSSGDTRYFQAWYRDPSGSPCGSGFNLSQALAVVFTP